MRLFDLLPRRSWQLGGRNLPGGLADVSRRCRRTQGDQARRDAQSVKTFILIGIALIATPDLSSAASAAEISMVCKNPRREHQVTYDDTSKIVLDQAAGANAAYRVTSVKEVGGGPQVTAKTVTKGMPDIRASFGRPKGIAYSNSGRVFQTEPCR